MTWFSSDGSARPSTGSTPTFPTEAREEALRKVLRVGTPSLVGANRAFHRMLRDGVEVEYRRKDGSIAGDRVQLIDFDNPANNDWLAVNQFTVIEGQHNRRPDIVVFINGLPLAVIELKNAADENATIWEAWKQLQTYKQEIPSLFHYNEVLIVSDGLQARIGSLTANKEWFKVWRTIAGEELAPSSILELEVLIRGVFDKERLLKLLRYFVAFEEDKDRGRSTRSWPATTNSMPCRRRWTPSSRRRGRPATGAAAWSGTRRAPARA